MYRFHRRLASFSRVIRFDHRGIGLSSRVPSMNMMGPKFWAEDAIAVMDAVGCEKATIFAPSLQRDERTRLPPTIPSGCGAW